MLLSILHGYHRGSFFINPEHLLLPVFSVQNSIEEVLFVVAITVQVADTGFVVLIYAPPVASPTLSISRNETLSTKSSFQK